MPTKKLTDLFVKGVKFEPEGRAEYWDELTPGFGLRVGKRSKSWVMLYRVNGKVVRETIGKVPALALADARKLARDKLAKAQDGYDPREPEARRTNTVEDLVDAFVEQHCKPRNKTWKAQESLLHKHVVPRWGSRKPDRVTKLEVNKMLAEVGEKKEGMDRRDQSQGGTYPAANVLKVVRAMYNFAIDHDLVDVNPALRARLPGKLEERDRWLTDDEVRALWHGSEGLGYPYGPWVRFLLATGQRRTEAGAISKGEIDGDVWLLPKERTKSQRAHAVPLSRLATEILAECPSLSGPYLFSSDGGQGPIGQYTEAKRLLDEASGVQGWRYHDLRRTAATGIARLGHGTDIIKRVLNHSVQGVTAIYNRYDYLDEKRTALEDWGERLREIANG